MIIIKLSQKTQIYYKQYEYISLLNSFAVSCFYMKPDTICIIISGVTDSSLYIKTLTSFEVLSFIPFYSHSLKRSRLFPDYDVT